MNTPPVYYENRDGIGWIQMDDGKVNAFNPPLLKAFHGALDLAQVDDLRAVVLTGRTHRFSAGMDLKMLPTLQRDALHAVSIQFRDMISRLLAFHRPVIGAISGHAIAGGAVLMLACDYKIGTQGDYNIGLNEVAIGISLPSFAVDLAKATLPPCAHLPAILHGTLYDVDAALSIGYLDELSPPEELHTRAIAKAEALGWLQNPAYTLTKHRLFAHLIEYDPQAYKRELDANFD